MNQTIKSFYFNTLSHYQHIPQKLSLLTSETVPWPPCCIITYHRGIDERCCLILEQNNL